jgi:hypothetical protein
VWATSSRCGPSRSANSVTRESVSRSIMRREPIAARPDRKARAAGGRRHLM